MRSRGRTLRFAAVSAAVALCLTGFTTGRGHGHGSHSGGDGGGGCSSSGQDHDSSSSSSGGGVYKDDDQGGSYGGSGSYRDSYDDNTDDYYGSDGGSGSGTSGPDLEDATVRLLSCATKQKPYATVEVTNPNPTEARFAVTVGFEDARGTELASVQERADVPANGKATVRVPFSGRDRVTKVDHCDPNPEAPAAG